MNKYDAIIIGSGAGGLATGLMLGHKGKKVLILEKNDTPGGRISYYEKQGFQMDLGVHVLSRSDKGPIGQVLNRCGIEYDMSFTRVRPVSSYNGQQFIFPHDLKDMVPQEDFESVLRFLGDIRKMSAEEYAQYDDITVKDFLLRYTKNDMIHSCLWMVTAIYLCLPTWEASAGEFMRCLKWEGEARASGYPEGGCSIIVNTYLDGIKKFNGEIQYSVTVDEIVVEDNKVVGVRVNGKLIESDMVISNTDIKATVLKLVGEEHFSEDYIQYIKGLRYSWSGMCVKLALDKKLTDIKMLSQLGCLDQEDFYEKLRQGIIPKDVNLFLVVPSNFSTSVAPEGQQLINFTIPQPLDIGLDIETKLIDAMIDTAEKYIPHLKEHILFREYLSIEALDKAAGMAGAGIGIGQVAGQVGSKRPPIKQPVEGLYVVGASAGGAGVGVELAMNSAIEFIDKYI